MRQLILNHVSLATDSRYNAVQTLIDVIKGIAFLVNQKVVENALRTSQHPPIIRCPSEVSIWDICFDELKKFAQDEYRYFLRISQKYPLLSEVAEDYKNRVAGCEKVTIIFSQNNTTDLSDEDGVPLLLCVVANWIAVGFPWKNWDQEEITIQFSEMLNDGSIQKISDKFDNLSRCDHAHKIYERYKDQVASGICTGNFWEKKNEFLPFLKFGPSVESNIKDLSLDEFSGVLKKLKSLNQSGENWQTQNQSAPSWGCHVTPERESTMNNPIMKNARRFESILGDKQIFEWHARFGSGGRIHFRYDSKNKEIEIGYIGQHLPI